MPGRHRFQLQFWQDGVSLFRRAVRLAPDNYLAHDFLGKALEDQGRSGEALDSYFESVRLDSHYPTGQFNLGTALLTCGRLGEAAHHLALALQDNPRYAWRTTTWVSCGEQGRWAEAGRHFVQAIEADPEIQSLFQSRNCFLEPGPVRQGNRTILQGAPAAA